MDDRIRALAQKFWDYHHLGHQPALADAILVLCSHDKGFQIHQEIPDEVWRACQQLVNAGYDVYLIKD